MGLNISKMWFWIGTLGSNLKETLIFNWNVIQFGALWAGNLLRHFLMIVELSVIPTNDSLIIRLNYLNLSFTLFLSFTLVSWTAALYFAKSCWAFAVEAKVINAKYSKPYLTHTIDCGWIMDKIMFFSFTFLVF